MNNQRYLFSYEEEEFQEEYIDEMDEIEEEEEERGYYGYDEDDYQSPDGEYEDE